MRQLSKVPYVIEVNRVDRTYDIIVKLSGSDRNAKGIYNITYDQNSWNTIYNNIDGRRVIIAAMFMFHSFLISKYCYISDIF
jgi:hypothetical protein